MFLFLRTNLVLVVSDRTRLIIGACRGTDWTNVGFCGLNDLLLSGFGFFVINGIGVCKEVSCVFFSFFDVAALLRF